MSQINITSPKVSVILPTYNHLAFLPLAIGSILNQSFQDFELVIVNDGSTDGTKEYLDSLRDPRVVVIHQQNKRLPGALNTGIQAARGEYLTWTSADNYCSQIFLEALVGALENNPDCGFAYSSYATIDEHDRISEFVRNQPFYYAQIIASNVGIASFMYRRECHESLGLYEPLVDGAEDWDMWVRILEHYAPVYVPDILYYYRQHSDSMTIRDSDKIQVAARMVYQRTLERHGNSFDIITLYPEIIDCKDQQQAKIHALFDFGNILLNSKFVPIEDGISLLQGALELEPNNIQIRLNLALGFAKAKNAQMCLSLLLPFEHVENSTIRKLVDSIVRYLQENLKVSDVIYVPMPITVTPANSELMQIRARQKKEFSFSSYQSLVAGGIA